MMVREASGRENVKLGGIAGVGSCPMIGTGVFSLKAAFDTAVATVPESAAESREPSRTRIEQFFMMEEIS